MSLSPPIDCNDDDDDDEADEELSWLLLLLLLLLLLERKSALKGVCVKRGYVSRVCVARDCHLLLLLLLGVGGGRYSEGATTRTRASKSSSDRVTADPGEVSRRHSRNMGSSRSTTHTCTRCVVQCEREL